MAEEEDEDYISYGTPLPDLEDEFVLRKKAEKELQVRDEKGRQRFHGAFTGGFSAGYFNTVGTKEGWAPSTFISSRSKTAERIRQNPEDFMDEEDLGEFGIATRKVHTTSDFVDLSEVQTQKQKYANVDSVIPGESPLREIIKPVRNSIGIKILQKLGWRPGQGIGPRVKKQGNASKVYGCSPFPDASVPEEDDPTALAYTFAPEDTDTLLYLPKDNYFGLGYSGLSKQSVLGTRLDHFAPTTTKSWLTKEKRKLTISGQAFGVGAFEDDDEDIYSKDDMSQYDFSDPMDKELNDSSTRGGKKQQDKLSLNSVLDGFHLATHPPNVKKHYPAPMLPPNFKPTNVVLTNRTPQNTQQNLPRHSLSADERSFMLGEKKFQAFKINAHKEAFEKKFQQETPAAPSKAPPVFRPFPNDTEKQQRYEEYIKLKNLGELEKLVQPITMTEWEKEQEIEEFAKAAILFQPLSSALKSKFESRSHLSVEHEVMQALEKIKKDKEEKSSTVKKKLVGSHNRKTFEWHPANLLCRRFNVPNPFPNSCSVGIPSSQKGSSIFDHLSAIPGEYDKCEPQSVSHISTSALKTQAAKMTEGLKEIVKQSVISSSITPVENTKETLSTTRKPSIDFFKDIFENTSSEDEDKDPVEQGETSSPLKTPSESTADKKNENSMSAISETINSPAQLPSSTSKKIGFGVFANLDLDALNQRSQVRPPAVQSSFETKYNMPVSEKIDIDSNEKESGTANPKLNSSISDEFYGPALPPDYSESSVSNSTKAESRHQGTKYKRKHKHKHHKHKSKKKRKKKSYKKSSEDESSDSDEDIPPSVIIEKLKKLQKMPK